MRVEIGAKTAVGESAAIGDVLGEGEDSVPQKSALQKTGQLNSKTRTRSRLRKVLWIVGTLTVFLILPHMGGAGQSLPRLPRLMIDQAPLTLNPRMAQDAYGQKLGALFFRALTRIDVNLQPQPDLAESWSLSRDGLEWRFKIRQGLKDQKGQSIVAADVVECLEQYRAGKPTSVLVAQMDSWKGTRAQSGTVVLSLSHPDPYLARNISLMRFFRTSSGSVACQDPGVRMNEMIGSGRYFPEHWEVRASDDLIRVSSIEQNRGPVEIQVFRSDHQRMLKLLNGDTDAMLNGLSLSKERWIQKNHSDRFRVLERPATTMSYLAFNLKDPILSRKEVRQAIALAIDRASIVRYKLHGFCELAGSLVAPSLEGGLQGADLAYDPAKAEALLDAAGYRRGSDGVRLRFKYRTTPVREGYESGLLFQEMLKKIGIELELEVSEQAVFLAKIIQGQFQMYSSRWVGVSDTSILYRTMHSKNPLNRVRYADQEMDRVLEKMMAEPDAKKRSELAFVAQRKMLDDLPYVPLWYWNYTLILKKHADWPEFSPDQISGTGSLEPVMDYLSERGTVK